MRFQVDEHATQRLQGLVELYNVADDGKTQHLLLQQAIAYATKANLANLLGPVVKVSATSKKDTHGKGHIQKRCTEKKELSAPSGL